MPSINHVAKRRHKAVEQLAKLPGAVLSDDADAFGPLNHPEVGEVRKASCLNNPAFLIGLNESGGKGKQIDLLLANTELLEFLDRVLTPLVARVEALEAEKRTRKGSN